MLNIVCVQSGNYQGRGAEYVNHLFDMVRRNLSETTEGRFICFTDDPRGIHANIEIERLPGHLKGWWNKLWLFRHGVFRHGDQVLYFDLSTCITGPLDEIAAYRGDFAILRDFYRPSGLQSSVMSWKVSEKTDAIYDAYKAARYPDFPGGDQAWLEQCDLNPDLWQKLFPGSFVSYKEHARHGIPKGSRVVCFHGHPKPHECGDWVPHVWKIGGGTTAEFVIACNTPIETIAENIRSSMKLPCQWLSPLEPHDGTALVVAGGPSLNDSLLSLVVHKASGAAIFAVNGALSYLARKNIVADYHVLLDARRENLLFVRPDLPATRIYSSQCHPEVAQRADILFHPFFDGVTEITGTTDGLYLGGGTTAGLKAILIAYVMGCRKFHLHGFDSCYRGIDGHAFPQNLNAGERIIEISMGGKIYHAAPWMVTQAEEFRDLAKTLVDQGCEIHVMGDGLIPDMAVEMAKPSPVEQRAISILEKIAPFAPVKGAEIGVFAAELSHRLLSARPDLTLYMVDSWSADHSDEYRKTNDFHTSLSQTTQDEFAERSRLATEFAGERAIILRKPSVDAAKLVPDRALDFVFIDADHSYEGCRADIEAWMPKIRPGGILCGHDYENTDFPKFGVKRAVDELLIEKGVTVEFGQNFTWFASNLERIS